MWKIKKSRCGQDAHIGTDDGGLELTNKLTYCLPPAADRHAFTCTAMQHVQCAVAAKWSIVEMFQLGVNVHMLFVI
jgi:hypothetical protein